MRSWILIAVPLLLGVADSCGVRATGVVRTQDGSPLADMAGQMCDYAHCVEVRTDRYGIFQTRFDSENPERSRATIRFQSSRLAAPIRGYVSRYDREKQIPFTAPWVELTFVEETDKSTFVGDLPVKNLPAENLPAENDSPPGGPPPVRSGTAH